MAVKDMLEYQFTSSQDRDKAAENGRKGGIASGISKRRKATFKKTLDMLLDEEYIQKGKSTGKTYRELSTLGLIKGAIDGKAENYKVMMQLMGELDGKEQEMPSLNINIIEDNPELEKALYEED